MSYNITLIENITNVGSVLGFLNVNAQGLYFVMFILTAVAIITMYSIANNMREVKALFFAFGITLIPTILLAVVTSFSTAFVPGWYVALHITLFAVAGVFTYYNK